MFLVLLFEKVCACAFENEKSVTRDGVGEREKEVSLKLLNLRS